MPNYNAMPTLAAPVKLHTLTESAEAARQAVREHGIRRRQEALVTKHPRPNVEHPVPTTAARLVKVAGGSGFEVTVVHGWWTMNPGASNERKAPAVRVTGKHRGKRLGFQSVWVDGRAKLGLWYAAPGGGVDVGVSGVAERVGAR